MYGVRVQPLDVEFLLGGQALVRLAVVEYLFQLPVPDGVKDEAVLIAQNSFFLLIGEIRALGLISVWRRPLADTAALHEDLGLQQQVGFPRLTLYVIDGVFVLDVGIEAKDHAT